MPVLPQLTKKSKEHFLFVFKLKQNFRADTFFERKKPRFIKLMEAPKKHEVHFNGLVELSLNKTLIGASFSLKFVF